jgi:hypothetical protein
MAHYVSLDMVKQKLRIEDSTIDDELSVYMDEVDELINRELRAKFGRYTEYGYEIPLPLTEDTNPPLTFDLRMIGADLVEGKFRLKTTDDDKLYNKALSALETYLVRSFGWTEGHRFRRYPDISITPTNGASTTTITCSGQRFKPRGKIIIKIVDENESGIIQATTPEVVLTDDSGDFSGITFATSSGTAIGSYVILATDKINFAKRNFTVTS